MFFDFVGAFVGIPFHVCHLSFQFHHFMRHGNFCRLFTIQLQQLNFLMRGPLFFRVLVLFLKQRHLLLQLDETGLFRC
jgi:hypothetical protein